MAGDLADEHPVVRISRLELTIDGIERDAQGGGLSRRCTVYGVDAEGQERVYAEHADEDEHNAWLESDPLWREAQRAIFGRLLDNPQTRDFALQVYIKAALDAGDTETAVALVRCLSSETWARLSREDTQVI